MQTSEKYKVINRDLLKFIAIIPMAVGHFIDFYCGASASLQNSWLLFLLAQASLIASPVFFFFIAEGFRHTHSLKKYALRLLLFAVITQIPYCLMMNGTLLTPGVFTYLNVFFTLFLGLIALIVSESGMTLWLKIALVLLLDAATVLLQMQWLVFGIPIILIFYYFREQPAKRLVLFALCAAGSLLIGTVPAAVIYMQHGRNDLLVNSLIGFAVDLCFLFAGYLIVTFFYNGEKGKHPQFAKWFFYLFYPAHLFVIFLAKLLAHQY